MCCGKNCNRRSLGAMEKTVCWCLKSDRDGGSGGAAHVVFSLYPASPCPTPPYYSRPIVNHLRITNDSLS